MRKAGVTGQARPYTSRSDVGAQPHPGCRAKEANQPGNSYNSIMLRKLIAYPLLLSMITLTGLLAQQKKAATTPTKLTFEAKNGNVTFNHVEHVKRAKDGCKTCHPAQWPQDAKAALKWKAGMHKPAEASKTSCGFCHHSGGAAFASQGNCTKCHVKVAEPKKG